MKTPQKTFIPSAAKTTKALIGFIAASTLLAASSHAQTIIIDGTGPGYTNNGSFESGTSGGPVNWLGNDTTSALANELGITQGLGYRNVLTPHDGAAYVVIGSNDDDSSTYGAYLNTGYTLSTGDTFDLSFWTGNHANIDAGDNLEYQLFTTSNNTDSGTISNIIYSNSQQGNTSQPTMIETSLTGIGNTTAAANGKTLFISFTYSSDDKGYIGLDQVNLTAIPEPSTTAGLVGISALLLAASRRRRS